MRKEYIELLGKLSNKQPKTMEFPQCLNLERTLDEAYYPGLSHRVLDAMNKDQVVSRESAHFDGGSTGSPPPKSVLMVPQLWIWSFDRYVVSACSFDDFHDRRLPFVREKLEKFGHTTHAHANKGVIDEESPKRQIGLRLVEMIEQFGQRQLFEAGVARVLAEVVEYMDPYGPSKSEIEREREFLNRISDIQGELTMVQEVLRQQKEVLVKIINDPPMDFALPHERN
jgi:hypothetical protein